MKKIKLSILRYWLEQALDDNEKLMSERQIHNRPLTEDEKEALRYGFIAGWDACHSTLRLQDIFKLIID